MQFPTQAEQNDATCEMKMLKCLAWKTENLFKKCAALAKTKKF